MMGNTITHHGEATLSQEPKVIWHLGRRRIALAGAVLATTVCVVLCSSWRVIPLLFGDGVLVYLACWPGQRNPSAISVAAADTDQQAEAEDAHPPAEDVRCREHLCKLADAVGSQLVHLLAPVSVGAQHMRDLADTVAAIAERSGENIVSSRMAADDSVEASRTLSMATTELENSITNIANQMLHATELSGAAVAAGADARTTMGQLTGQVRSVGNVTGRIAGLARQTNLLALNATIEAARAGNAGSGFAVVAGEVKLLARQTATLTDEIAQLIAAVERVSLDAVGKVNFMEQRIIQIEAIAGRIAGEIEEQRRATANIADNVQQTAAASTTLSSQLENLTVTMMESLDQTAAIHVAANSLVIDADQIDNNLRRCLTEAIVLISRSECNDTAASMEGRRGEGAAPG